ncbi:spermatogenesis-associated protein 2-like protein [Clarias magur]|uniref:Spermatogenesis-associated protein 2-like protein n=1 Tax=Clarias magur TaxID=1594786 RepID=A0A8J4WYS4_CLAMG|nr:spermatogenesis-associated protein 2-like protein [Clarias magur]
MSAGMRKTGIGCMEIYQASLERRIQQGEWDLVCQEEELCKEVETLLLECSPQNIYSQPGLDTLSVIEASLRASQHTLSFNRLNSLVKAFKVLELAALNLYLCPWRKEYKVVKMFSGMFTHCVKPALTAQQAQELFALLGYQPAGNDEEELRLSTKPVNSHALLQLAYCFFTARIECQLLLTAVASLDGSMECMLQLVQERKHGCTFQTALDSAKRKLEPAPCDTPSALDPTLDLYTDEYLAEQSHMASPPSLPYIPPSEDKLSRINTSHSNKERDEKTAQTIAVSPLTCQIKAMPNKIDSGLKSCENDRQFTTMCNGQLSAAKEGNCLSYELHPKQSLRCQDIHSEDCPCLTSFTVFQSRQDQTQHWEKPAKDDVS